MAENVLRNPDEIDPHDSSSNGEADAAIEEIVYDEELDGTRSKRLGMMIKPKIQDLKKG